MLIAIHHRPGSFSEKWIEYCRNHDVHYKIVNCYSTDIVEQLRGCDGLMWHWAHHDYKASLFARQLTYSLEAMGKKVFPSAANAWHYDDKVGQKYLLESISAPLVPSYVFYRKQEAMNWAASTTYPKVFKLRGGAGAENVRIARSRTEAERYIKKSFGRGYKVKSRLNFVKERVWHFKRDKSIKSFANIGKGFARLVLPTEVEKNFPPERNYAYFQDFVPNNDSDIRVIVIGRRAFAIKRMVRKGDFRASGSGEIIYDPKKIPQECLKIAFEVSSKITTQSLAYDFVFDSGQPLVVEISYAFSREGYFACPGHWTDQLEWVDGSFSPEYFMIEDFIEGLL